MCWFIQIKFLFWYNFTIVKLNIACCFFFRIFHRYFWIHIISSFVNQKKNFIVFIKFFFPNFEYFMNFFQFDSFFSKYIWTFRDCIFYWNSVFEFWYRLCCWICLFLFSATEFFLTSDDIIVFWFEFCWGAINHCADWKYEIWK